MAVELLELSLFRYFIFLCSVTRQQRDIGRMTPPDLPPPTHIRAHADVAKAYNNMATIEEERGHDIEALALHKKALEIKLREVRVYA